tara:strand:+ start:513 stop:806 length:294 start_codon:yes stop_codon:yes gene_type:complete
MNLFSKFIIIIIFFFNICQCFAQSSSSNVTIISSPDKEVAASAQNGANTIQILNSSGLSFASTFNIGLASLALGLIAVSVWDGSDSEQSSTSSTSTN